MNTAEQLSTACPVCESTNTSTARVRSAFWHDDRLVVIEDVPALVCRTCGEQFYDDNTVRMIDRMRAKGFPTEEALGELRVPVFAFGDIEAPEADAPSAELPLFTAVSEVVIRS